MSTREARRAYLDRRRERLLQEARAHERELVARNGDRIVQLVRDYVAENGRGPTWGELRHLVRLTRPEIQVVIEALAEQRRLVFTKEKHSLRSV